MRKAKKVRRLCLLFAAFLTVALMFGACGGGGQGSSGSSSSADSGTKTEDLPAVEDTLDNVELLWYAFGFPDSATVEGLKAVTDKVNSIIQPQINATINLVLEPDLQEKMNVRIAANEYYDMVFSAFWLNDFYGHAARGAFADLNDALAKHGEYLFGSIPQAAWDAVNVNGKTLAVPSWRMAAGNAAFLIRKDLADKYGFTPSRNTSKWQEDIETFLSLVRENDPQMTPMILYPDSAWASSINAGYGYMGDRLVEVRVPGTLKAGDSTLTVINEYETEDFKQFCIMMRKWRELGFLAEDSIVGDGAQQTADIQAGLVAAVQTANDPRNIATTESNWGQEMLDIPQAAPYMIGNMGAGSATAVGLNSKNVDRCVMLLSLINSDPVLYNTFVYGVEGVHWNKVDGIFVEAIPDSGYRVDIIPYWSNGGNQANMYPPIGTDPDIIAKENDLMAKAVPCYINGFILDVEPIRTQIANTKAVGEELLRPLEHGMWEDVETKVQEYISQLKAAGSDDIIAELQKQLNAWKK